MFYKALKYSVFGLNAFSLVLGVGFIVVCAMGLDNSSPDTDGHTYFIVGIILGSFICMASLFGCYGVVGELLGLLLIYAFFMLMLMLVQYLQMRTFQPQAFHMDEQHHLEAIWNQMDSKPYLMETLEVKLKCCGLHNSRDYNYLRLTTPKSCYINEDHREPSNLHPIGCLQALQAFFGEVTTRDRVFNWILTVMEGLSAILTTIFCVLLFRQTHGRQLRAVSGYVEQPPRPRHNHVSSRRNLIEAENEE